MRPTRYLVHFRFQLEITEQLLPVLLRTVDEQDPSQAGSWDSPSFSEIELEQLSDTNSISGEILSCHVLVLWTRFTIYPSLSPCITSFSLLSVLTHPVCECITI